MAQSLEGTIVTKQMLLSMCLCEKSRYKLYRKFDGTIYIIDTVNRFVGFFIEFGSNIISKSFNYVPSIEEYEKITSIDRLKDIMASSYTL